MTDYKAKEQELIHIIYNVILKYDDNVTDEVLSRSCVVYYWNEFVKDYDINDTKVTELPSEFRQYFEIETEQEPPIERLILKGNYTYRAYNYSGMYDFHLCPLIVRSLLAPLYQSRIIKEVKVVLNPNILVDFDKTVPAFLTWANDIIAKTRNLFKVNQVTASSAQGYAKDVLKDQTFKIIAGQEYPIIRIMMKRHFVLSVVLAPEKMEEIIDSIPNLIHNPLLIKDAGRYYHLDKGDYRCIDETLIDTLTALLHKESSDNLP